MGKAAAELAVSQPVVSKAIADLERALKARLLVRLEATLHAPSAVVIGLSEGNAQLLDIDLDAVLGEGHGVDLLPRGAGPHDRVADVQEDRAQGRGATMRLPARRGGSRAAI